MTTTETEATPKRRTSAARIDVGAPFTAEALELADRGVRIARTAAESTLRVGDTVVLGTLSLAQAWAEASPVAGLAVPPVKVAKDTWTTASEGMRDLVAVL
jgi:hypothetical protein